MKDESGIRAGLIALLANLNAGRRTLTERDVQAVLDREERDFGEKVARTVMKALEERKLIGKNGGDYTVLTDIATVREMILEDGKTEAPAEAKEREIPLQKLLDTEWVIPEAYYNIRLIRRRSEQYVADVHAFYRALCTRLSEEGGVQSAAVECFRSAEGTLRLSSENGKVFVSLQSPESERRSVRFKAFRKDSEVWFSDSMTAMRILTARSVETDAALERLEQAALRFGAERMGYELCIGSGEPESMISNLQRLSSAVKCATESEERKKKPETEDVSFTVGTDERENPQRLNIAQAGHILIAGDIGSGKTSFLRTVIDRLIVKNSPDCVRLILGDLMAKEFEVYAGMPHLLTEKILSDPNELIGTLHWALGESERRYEIFLKKTAAGIPVRNLKEYRETRREDEENLPRIVIIVDEFAEFSPVSNALEEAICRLVQKSRAAGIHLILSTGRPYPEVLTRAIKGNFFTKIAFGVETEQKSRYILDTDGAETLRQPGELLLRSEFSVHRLNANFVSFEDLCADVFECMLMYKKNFDKQIAAEIERRIEHAAQGDDADQPSDVCIKALWIAVQKGKISLSEIQRKCIVGYNHAGKILEWMESMGYITPFDGKSGGRTVLLTLEEFLKRYKPPQA